MYNGRLLLWCVLFAGCSRATGGTLQGSAAYSGGSWTNIAANRSDVSFRHQMSPNVARFRSLYSFKGGLDGSFPPASLLYLNGALYGTTGGNASQPGTVFKVTLSGKETVLADFKPGAGGGTAGYGPFGGLVNIDGVLYGTTEGGAAYNGGTLFSITPSGALTVLHTFGNRANNDGNGPSGNLLNVKGTIYGTTVAGGSGDGEGGTVFAVDVHSATFAGAERVLYSFNGPPDGFKPFSAGVIDLDGTLYGTTWYGGSCGTTGCGTVFKVAPTGTETVLHSFGHVGHIDGVAPVAGLVAFNGILYGTTYNGGTYNAKGTVYKVAPSGAESVLHSFGSGLDGALPESNLIAVDGALYGTTSYGGASGAGTVFKITPSGTESILHSFSGRDGAVPSGGLIAVDGTLYGTTGSGGTSGYGTVFSLAL